MIKRAAKPSGSDEQTVLNTTDEEDEEFLIVLSACVQDSRREKASAHPGNPTHHTFYQSPMTTLPISHQDVLLVSLSPRFFKPCFWADLISVQISTVLLNLLPLRGLRSLYKYVPQARNGNQSFQPYYSVMTRFYSRDVIVSWSLISRLYILQPEVSNISSVLMADVLIFFYNGLSALLSLRRLIITSQFPLILTKAAVVLSLSSSFIFPFKLWSSATSSSTFSLCWNESNISGWNGADHFILARNHFTHPYI